MNADKLLQLADFLEQLPPERFDFCHWVSGDWEQEQPLSLYSCGTAGCAGGWATVIWPDELKLINQVPTLRGEVTDYGEPIVGVDALAKFFGIRREESVYLFLPEGEFAPELRGKKQLPRTATATEVAAHIRQFVKDHQDASPT